MRVKKRGCGRGRLGIRGPRKSRDVDVRATPKQEKMRQEIDSGYMMMLGYLP